MRRLSSLGLVMLATTGCFDPGLSDTGFTATAGTNSTGRATDASGAPDASASVGQTDADPTSPSEGDTDCGNAQIDDGEACDDGINDGSYGGCSSDCAAAGPSCGDGAINGPEMCDDGTNDGGYDGCQAGCAALGPYCGDGATHISEGCDEGKSNQNGFGCNADCVVSGSDIAEFSQDGLSFCDGAFTTRPVFRDDGNALVSASGYCDNDTLLLLELSPEVELEQDLSNVVLPSTPLETAALRGDDWILASYGCNYVVSPTGDLSEVCDQGRVTGVMALLSRTDTNYLALSSNVFARFGPQSPAVGDTPLWTLLPPNNPTYSYFFNAASFGPMGSAFVAGSRRRLSDNIYAGYIAQVSAGGNISAVGIVEQVSSISALATSPDGGLVVMSGYPDFRLTQLDPELGVTWSSSIATQVDTALAVDSVGDIVLGYNDPDSQWVLQKIAADGASERWSRPYAFGGFGSRIAIDANDAIWVAVAGYNGFSGQLSVSKVAP